MATKLRALYQRCKGRDLFDLWYVASQKLINLDRVINIFNQYCSNDDISITKLETLFDRLLKQWECELMEFNGEADHVHLLLSTHPKAQPSKLINNLKTVTSRMIRKEFTSHVSRFYYKKSVFWSRTYCFISVGGAPLSVLKQYIQNQAEIE